MDQMWQVEWFGTQPLPAWTARPFLAGNYLTIPTAARYAHAHIRACTLITPPTFRLVPLSIISTSLCSHIHTISLSLPLITRSPDVEAYMRCYPSASLEDIASARRAGRGAAARATPDLRLLPHATQEAVLVREVLMALTGVEGTYIRVPGVTSATDANGTAPPPASVFGMRGSPAKSSSVKARHVHFALDESCADRGLVSQASAVLPLCEAASRVRDFIGTHSRHEYGSISHALVGAMRTMLREFDVLVAQLDGLYRTGNHGGLSMQKLTYFLQVRQGAAV